MRCKSLIFINIMSVYFLIGSSYKQIVNTTKNTNIMEMVQQKVNETNALQRLGRDLDKSHKKVSFLNQNYTEKVQMGDEGHLGCLIDSDDDMTVMWLKLDKTDNEEETITINYTTMHTDKRFRIKKHEKPQNWELSIKYTQKSDAGIYACRAFADHTLTLYVELILIEAVAKILDTDENEPGTIKVKLFSPLRLSCVLHNSISPPTYIFWYHFDTMINYDLEDNASVRRGRQGSELIFPKTESRHQGNYSCVPSNARQANIVVDVHGEYEQATVNRACQFRNTELCILLFIIVFSHLTNMV